MIKKFKKGLRNNNKILEMITMFKQLYYKHFFSDEKMIQKRFLKERGRKVDLDNPIEFGDKLQWLKLNWYDPLAVKCADKYEVRRFVKKAVGSEFLNEVYAVYNSIEEI